jgi:hypothetical protein
MKNGMPPTFRSLLPALTAIAITTLLAASFVGATQTVRWLGSSTLIAPATTA